MENILLLLFGTVAAKAEYCQEIVFDFHIRAGKDKRFQLIFLNGKADYLMAFVAVEILMNAQFSVEAIRFTGDGNAANFTNLHKSIQIAVNGAQAESGANLAKRCTDLFGSWMIIAGKDLLQDQFTLV